jgi:hypothetical protein
MPPWFHKSGVLFNHLAELVAPWFAFGPRLARHVAGAILLFLPDLPDPSAGISPS